MREIFGQTVWQAMQGRTRDLLLGSAIIYCLITLLYGCYQFYEFGPSIVHYARSYIPIIGSIIAGLCLIVFSISGSRLALIPCRVFALYILSILGTLEIASSIWPAFDVWEIAKGAFWALLGWKMFRRLGKVADLTRAPIDLPDLKDHLISHVGLHRRDLLKLALDDNLTARLGKWI